MAVARAKGKRCFGAKGPTGVNPNQCGSSPPSGFDPSMAILSLVNPRSSCNRVLAGDLGTLRPSGRLLEAPLQPPGDRDLRPTATHEIEQERNPC